MTLNDFIELFRSELTGTDPLSLNAQTKFRDLEEWSSLMAIDVVSVLSQDVGKNVDYIELIHCETIEDIYNAVINSNPNEKKKSISDINLQWED